MIAPNTPATMTQTRKNTCTSLPTGATAEGRRIYITDAEGSVIATAPRAPEEEEVPLTNILGETQPLTTFGERAGVLVIGNGRIGGDAPVEPAAQMDGKGGGSQRRRHQAQGLGKTRHTSQVAQQGRDGLAVIRHRQFDQPRAGAGNVCLRRQQE